MEDDLEFSGGDRQLVGYTDEFTASSDLWILCCSVRMFFCVV
ncbi:hypothetical protein SOVF_095790 [Spinacia oleracea]|nr:hypothetical protein SOVF_095790 [Spinacia oleracea]